MSNSCCSKPPAEVGQRAPPRPDRLVALGRISGVWGIRGWIKIRSYSREIQEIFSYFPWYVGASEERVGRYLVAEHRVHNGALLARLEGIDDRDRAGGLVGQGIFVDAKQLPPLEPGEFYWFQLEGLTVVTGDGVELGVVDHLLETGANDVLVIEGDRQRLLPYTPAVVLRIDLGQRRMEVDWDPDF